MDASFIAPTPASSQDDTQVHPYQEKNYLLKVMAVFLGVYVLFVISILVSVLHTEWKHFHSFLLNNYVLGKVFLTALGNTLLVLASTSIFHKIIKFLHIYRKHGLHDADGKQFSLKGNYFLDVAVFLLVTVVLVPLRTVVAAFYVGTDGTFFRFNFVHFSTEAKIILSACIVLAVALYIVKKYSFKTMSLLTLLAVLALPAAYGILNTRPAHFAALEADIIALNNQDLFRHAAIVDPELGKQLKPKAEKLLSIASNDQEAGSAYEWLAVSELTLGNFEESLAHIATAEALDPQDSRKYFIQAQIYRASGKYDQARESATRCSAIALENNTPHNIARCEGEIAAAYQEEGDKVHGYRDATFFVNSRTHYEKAALLAGDQVFYTKALQGLLLSEAINAYFNSEFSKAISKLDEYIAASDPATYANTMSRAYALRGDVKVAAGDMTGGFLDLEHSLELYPEDNKAALGDMGQFSINAGNYEKARGYFRMAIDGDPNNVHTPSNQELLALIESIAPY